MTWRTHVLAGVSSLWLVHPSSGDPIALFASLAALGALLPDLDANDSKIRHLHLLPGIEPFVLPGQALHRRFGHRGVLHSGLGIACCSAFLSVPVGAWLGWKCGAALLLGYVSHVMLDSLTRTGVPLFYPRTSRFWLVPPPLRVTTGSVEEEAFLALFGVLALLLLLLLVRRIALS